MQASDIQRVLKYHFNSHKYELQNSFVFNWECDFFSITKAGYAYEVEIKVSRSDFFADFKKEKHILFNKIIEGKAFYWKDIGKSWEGSQICSFKYKTLEPPFRSRGKDLPAGVVYDYKSGKYITNQWDGYYLREHNHQTLNAPATRIRFIDLTKISFPNRFYYACPEGLIKPEEIPKYAGLYYATPGDLKMIKQAPLLSKRIMDLKPVLLEKFYYECVRLRHQISMSKL